MKKSIVKPLSAFLAFVLILSMLPMAAFAAEDIAPCAECSHNFNVTHKSIPVATSYTELGHTVTLVDEYKCSVCGYTFTVNTGTSTVRHVLVKEYFGTTGNENGDMIDVYVYKCTGCNYQTTEAPGFN